MCDGGPRSPEDSLGAPQGGGRPARMRRSAMPFTYKANPSPSGNANIRRVCNNPKCGGVFYISYGAQNYRCPHCDFAQ